MEWVQVNMREFNLERRFGFVARSSLQHLLLTDDLLVCFAALGSSAGRPRRALIVTKRKQTPQHPSCEYQL